MQDNHESKADWVRGYETCTPKHIIELLVGPIVKDLDIANPGVPGFDSVVNGTDPHTVVFLRRSDFGGGTTVVAATGNELTVATRISVWRPLRAFVATTQLSVETTTGLSAENKCQIVVDHAAMDAWKVSRKAIRGLVFGGR